MDMYYKIYTLHMYSKEETLRKVKISMNSLHLYAIMYGVLTLWNLTFIFLYYKRLTCMVGMMAAMVLGMTAGLGIGSLLSVWLPGQFFYANISGMLIGGMIGVLAGVPVSIMAVLDGLLSGIMGGMMGAMLIEMTPASHSELTLKLMSLLFIGICFILYIMLLSESKVNQKSFVHPRYLFAVSILFLVSSHFITSPEVNSAKEISQNHDHKQISSFNTSLYNREIFVDATDFSFNPSVLEIKANEKIKLTLINKGKSEHDFEITGGDERIHIHAKTGESSSDIISLTTPGNYKVICTLPGHMESGMVASLNVR